jgi:hypothetical protein
MLGPFKELRRTLNKKLKELRPILGIRLSFLNVQYAQDKLKLLNKCMKLTIAEKFFFVQSLSILLLFNLQQMIHLCLLRKHF